MRKLFLIICVAGFFFCGEAFAQQKGKVEVIKDPQIDSLIAKRLELSRSAKSGSAVSANGFRVQIFSGTDRKKAYAEQSRFKSGYPSIGAYITYAQPSYKVRVGDCRTRLEAEKLLNKLKPQYPTLFIIPEKVNLR